MKVLILLCLFVGDALVCYADDPHTTTTTSTIPFQCQADLEELNARLEAILVKVTEHPILQTCVLRGDGTAHCTRKYLVPVQ